MCLAAYLIWELGRERNWRTPLRGILSVLQVSKLVFPRKLVVKYPMFM